jgi:Transposase DDE domain
VRLREDRRGGCSATTLRRRRDEWIDLGLVETLRRTALEAYDRIIGLELSEVAVDCCITKAPCGGEKAGRSPVDRGKAGVKRSVAVDGRGIPLGCVTAPASRHDSPLLVPTLDAAGALGLAPGGATVHLDRGYDSKLTRERLLGLGLLAEISEKGRPAPLNATRRWVVERTNSWQNAHKKLVWCTERRGRVAGLLGGPLGRGRHRQAAGSRGLAPLPLGGTTLSTTVTYWRSLLDKKPIDPAICLLCELQPHHQDGPES